MPQITITTHARSLLIASAIYPFEETGSNRDDDGNWVVPISEVTLNALKAEQLAGETVSDTIERILSSKN
jgi:hypothetical protein